MDKKIKKQIADEIWSELSKRTCVCSCQKDESISAHVDIKKDWGEFVDPIAKRATKRILFLLK